MPEDLKNMPAIVGGKDMDFTYGDCQKEMDMVNKAFIEIMIDGDAQGRGFQYPIPTYSITKDFDWSDNENNRLLFEILQNTVPRIFLTILTAIWNQAMCVVCVAVCASICVNFVRRVVVSSEVGKHRICWCCNHQLATNCIFGKG